jgi:hypothetical protein
VENTNMLLMTGVGYKSNGYVARTPLKDWQKFTESLEDRP